MSARLESELGSVARLFSAKPRLASVKSPFIPSDLVLLADTWVLLAASWTSRLIVGWVDPGVAVFSLLLFIALVGTRADANRIQATAIEDVRLIMLRSIICFGLTAALVVLTSTGDSTLLLYTASAAATALVASRMAGRKIEITLRRGGARANVLIIGAGEIARQIVSASKEQPQYGLSIVGAVDDEPRYGDDQLGAPLLGGLRDAHRLLREHQVQILVVAFSHTNPGEMVRVIRDAQAVGAAVWVVPRFFELGRAGGGGELLWGLPLVRLGSPAPSHPQWAFKRALDVLLASVGLFIAAPVMALCAAAVLVESGRPALLRQRRVSANGREFTILKFRTMREPDPSLESTEWAANPLRVTRVGAFLRDKSLDELPQLFNVLRGDMSLVGPRPERPHFVDLFSSQYRHYNDRHRVPAGITGWAQIHGLRGDDTSLEDRVVFDNNYIDGWSISEDFRIMARTVKTLMGQGDR